VSVAFVPAPGGEAPAHPCIAFAIGRRVGPAVVRNRLRRRLRDEVATLARAGRVPAGAYLIGLTPGAAELDGPTLRDHLRRALGVER
jgi:ribonuclease P protein component